MFTQLLSKEMTRKEFLVYLGTLLIGVFGIANFVNLLSKPSQKSPRDYSYGPYGGAKKGT